MIFTRYIDMVMEDETVRENIRMEMDIPEGEILLISPMLTDYGAKYKQVSVLQDRYGNQYKVKGNYKDLIEKIRPGRTKIGY